MSSNSAIGYFVIGQTGPTGPTGNSGATGPTSTVVGNTGNSGATGLTGMTGVSGSTGGIGLTGNSGATGNPGATGGIGMTGNSGATGPTSTVVGSTGNSGATGATGAIGLTGNSGSTGGVGLTGNSGATGPVGPTGVLAPGNTGMTGNTGATGVGGVTGATGSGGAGDQFTYWNADAVPVSPSSYDDEFEGSGLDAKWTKVNWDSASPLHSYDVHTTMLSRLYSSNAPNGAVQRAILQAVPAGDFTIWTKVFIFASDGFPAVGLILTDGTTAGAGNQQTFVKYGSGYGMLSRTITNFNTDGSYSNWTPVNDTDTTRAREFYIRVRRSGSTYYFSWSPNGQWWEREETITVGFTPSHMGLVTYKNGGSAPIYSFFDYFRYNSSATAMLGRILTVANGITGSTGSTGTNGVTGPTGAAGSTGTTGGTGATGTPMPRVSSTTSSSTPTPNADTTDLYCLTALAATATFGAPTGTPVNGQKLMVRIKDNGSAQGLGFNAAYVAGGIGLPTTTVAGKIMTLGFMYNTDNSLNKWMLIALAQEA